MYQHLNANITCNEAYADMSFSALKDVGIFVCMYLHTYNIQYIHIQVLEFVFFVWNAANSNF